MRGPAFFSNARVEFFFLFLPAATAPNGQTTADGKDGIKIKNSADTAKKDCRFAGAECFSEK